MARIPKQECRKLQYFRSEDTSHLRCKHKLVVKGLGFTRLNQIVEREDTPSIRGMVAKVPHLVGSSSSRNAESQCGLAERSSDLHSWLMQAAINAESAECWR